MGKCESDAMEIEKRSYTPVRRIMPGPFECVLKLIHCGGGALFRMTEERSSLSVEEVIDLPLEWLIQIEDPQSDLREIVSQAMETRKVWDGSIGGRRGIAIPIGSGDEVLGAVLLHGWEDTCSRSVELVDVARVLQWMMEAVSEIDRKPDSLAEPDQLRDVLVALTSTNQLDEILGWVIAGIRLITDVEAGSILLLDEEQHALVVKKTLEGEPNWMFHVNLEIGQGLAGECARMGESILVNDVSVDPRFFPDIDAVTGIVTRSILCVPMIVRRRVLGVIEVINHRLDDFHREDQELLLALASVAASAIQRTRMVHRLTITNADLEASRWEFEKSRNTFGALIDHISAHLYIVDREYRLLAANQECMKHHWGAERGVFGEKCFRSLYRREEPCPGCRVKETLFQGRDTRRMERKWLPDGQVRYLEINSFPIRDFRGDAEQAIVISQDVTDRKQLEESLARSERLAVVGQLASGVAHEINNPLSVIIANAQRLQRFLDASDRYRPSVDMIYDAGFRAQHIVQRLMDLAQPDEGQRVATDVNATIQHALQWLEDTLGARFELLLNLEEDLPVIEANPESLRGMWVNLLIYLIDTMPRGLLTIQIQTVLKEGKIFVELVAHSEGRQVERDGQQFRPLSPEIDPGRSTGLGLTFCHRIMRQHNGEIFIHHHPDDSIRFQIVLPQSR
jgi:PAS domain S-box-containing protein